MITINGSTGISGVDGSSATPAMQGTDTNTGISYGTDTVTINTGGTARVTTDASGNVGVGVTPSAWSLGKAIEVNNVGNALWGVAVSEIDVSQNSYYNGGWKYASSSFASRYMQNTGAHSWFTAPSGTAGNTVSFTQAMTLDASGNLLVGKAAANGATLGNTFGLSASGLGYNEFVSTNAGGTLAVLYINRQSSNGTAIEFRQATTTVGAITVTGSATTYATSSDYRLKENIQPMTGALAKVAQLKPCTYTWKADGSDGQGFIAHELQAVVPDCVTGAKDAVDKNGKPQYQGVDTSFLVATLVAAIQEQQATIKAMETRLAALEA